MHGRPSFVLRARSVLRRGARASIDEGTVFDVYVGSRVRHGIDGHLCGALSGRGAKALPWHEQNAATVRTCPELLLADEPVEHARQPRSQQRREEERYGRYEEPGRHHHMLMGR